MQASKSEKTKSCIKWTPPSSPPSRTKKGYEAIASYLRFLEVTVTRNDEHDVNKKIFLEII
jgi:hypothetical protein